MESQNLSPKKEKSSKSQDKRPVFLVVPQRLQVQPQPQRLLYSIQQSAALVEVPQQKALVYASAPLVALPTAELQTAKLQLLPASSATTTSVFTPYSSSFVQVFQ